jgi:hypothetical protein
MLVAWPHLSEQFSNTERARAALGPLTWDQRAAAVDQPAFQLAREIARLVPDRGCVLMLAYAGPEHLRYYRSRFAYYLYPRRVRLTDQSSESASGCSYLAVFRDSRQSLAQDPFRGHWDDHELAARTAQMSKLFSSPQLEVFQSPHP